MHVSLSDTEHMVRARRHSRKGQPKRKKQKRNDQQKSRAHSCSRADSSLGGPSVRQLFELDTAAVDGDGAAVGAGNGNTKPSTGKGMAGLGNLPGFGFWELCENAAVVGNSGNREDESVNVNAAQRWQRKKQKSVSTILPKIPIPPLALVGLSSGAASSSPSSTRNKLIKGGENTNSDRMLSENSESLQYCARMLCVDDLLRREVDAADSGTKNTKKTIKENDHLGSLSKSSGERYQGYNFLLDSDFEDGARETLLLAACSSSRPQPSSHRGSATSKASRGAKSSSKKFQKSSRCTAVKPKQPVKKPKEPVRSRAETAENQNQNACGKPKPKRHASKTQREKDSKLTRESARAQKSGQNIQPKIRESTKEYFVPVAKIYEPELIPRQERVPIIPQKKKIPLYVPPGGALLITTWDSK